MTRKGQVTTVDPGPKPAAQKHPVAVSVPLCGALCGSVWQCVVVSGSVVVCGSLWQCVTMCGSLWQCVEFCASV